MYLQEGVEQITTINRQGDGMGCGCGREPGEVEGLGGDGDGDSNIDNIFSTVSLKSTFHGLILNFQWHCSFLQSS